MKVYPLVLMFSFFFKSVFGQAVPVVNEAPHVFHKNGQLITLMVVGGKLFSNTVETRDQVNVPVRFADHEDWNFTVKLKKEITEAPAVSKGAEHLLFISDIEGEFAGFRTLLIANKVMDAQYRWTFGTGKLVICGDLFDRGQQVTEVLWLLYKLEQDAVAAGGAVHTILGNHDIMNLSGDFRYLDPKYIEVAKVMELPYAALFSEATELGQWLRSKNIIEKIGDQLCAHAGIAPQINAIAMPLATINAKCRPYYDKALILSEVAKLDSTVGSFFSGNTSLFWYRGYFSEPKATVAEVDATLALYHCKQIVVGHTIVPGNVGFYYDGKVLGLDVNQHAGMHQAALLSNGIWYKVDDKGNKTLLKP